MTDVTISAPDAAPSNASDQNYSQPPSEVTINQNPVNSPAALGSQIPERPPAKSQSAREAVQAAFDRANNPPPKGAKPAEKPAPKAAEAKAGHNQPPEETPKIDLKKRPGDQPVAEAQPRDKGRFAPRQAESAANSGQVRSETGQPGQPYKRLPPHAPFAEPPGRIAEHARRDWADTPETVRGEVHRMQAEFGKAAQYYKGAADAFAPVAKFHQMALEQGTTLERAVSNYVSMEQKLRSDPIAALDVIIRNLGMKDPQSGRPIGLRDVAYFVLNQSPEQLKQVQQGNAQQAATHQIGALHQEIAGLKNYLHQVHTQQQFTQTRSAVDQFADTHPRFDELGDLIERELKAGYDLNTAYMRADLLRPATHAAQTRNPSAQTRQSDKSIYGAPGVAPSNGASRKPREASPTPRAAVQNALNRFNGTF